MNQNQKAFVELKKREIKTHAPEIVGGVLAIVGGIAALIYVKKASAMVEPPHYSGNNSSVIVLENTTKGENRWQDMDEPDSFYRLEPA